MKKSSLELELLQKCKAIRLVLSDVDGVLTDGGMYYSANGELLKKFNTRDGMAVELLQKNNIKTVLITRENSKIAKQRGKKMKAVAVYTGVQTKEDKLEKICTKFMVQQNEIAYIGDDINDIAIMKLVGLSATPLDGSDEVKKIANYICKLRGGDGVLRELANFILSSKGKSGY